MMKFVSLTSALFLICACTVATARAGEDTPEPAASAVEETTEDELEASVPADDTAAAPVAAPVESIETAEIAAPPTPHCGGALKQGGLVVCQAQPGTQLTVGSTTLTVADDGQAVFGIGRAAPDSLNWSHASGANGTLSIEKRTDQYRELTGLDCDKVDARSEEQKAHASRSWVKKQDAFATFNNGPGASMGFLKPSDAPESSPFGPTRKYIGVSKVTGEPCESTSVHRGYDMAAPIGTPVMAPADGTIILGDPDLYYEGGTVFLDHGHGLVSVFMHLSEVDVAAGDVVKQGDVIAKTGNSGRTTGPHLHWAVKWRNPEADTRKGDFYIDPALLLDLQSSEAGK